MKVSYYDVHVFYDRKNGFSSPIKIESDKTLTDEEVIEYAVNNEHIDSEDARYVDNVTEISEDEYDQMIV